MRPSQKTMLLGAVAGVLLGLNFLDVGTGQRLAAQLPAIEALPRDEVTRIEISTAVEKVVLESELLEGAAGEGVDKRRWRLVAPVEGEADQVAVRTLLNNFRKDVSLDVKVDEGNLEDYGLDATNGLVVEMWKGEGEPAVSFTLGFDGPGGSSFLRLSGDDAVYRARVGGRHRYEKKGAEWRNRVLLDFTEDQAAGLTVTQAGVETLHLVREASPGLGEDGQPALGGWTLDPAPPWAVDQNAARNLVTSLGALRAGELLGADYDGGFAPPAAVIEVGLADGSTRALEVGSRQLSGAAFVRVQGKPTVYRTARPALDAARLPVAEFRDKTLFAFQRTDVDTLSFESGGRTRMILQQDLATNLWRVIEPPNVDVDIKLVFFAVNTMAELRADDVAQGVTPAQAGLVDPAERVVAHMLDGTDRVLELGVAAQDERGRPVRYARVGGKPEIYVLRQQTVDRIRQGFGQQ